MSGFLLDLGMPVGPAFGKGFLLGLSVAAPVGPIGMLCIRRTLNEGRWSGFTSGLGAATADALYGALAAFGLTAVARLLVAESQWLHVLGGLFLLYLGWRTLRAVPAAQAAAPVETRGLGAFGSTFLLTIANPMTVMSFAAVFAGLGLSAESGPGTAVWLVSGIFLGSALWWLILSTGVGLLSGQLAAGRLRWLNRLSGLVITGYGLSAFASLLPRWPL